MVLDVYHNKTKTEISDTFVALAYVVIFLRGISKSHRLIPIQKKKNRNDCRDAVIINFETNIFR